jgi:hypothetical protein
MVVSISLFTILIMLLDTSTMFFLEEPFSPSSLEFTTEQKRDLESESLRLLVLSTFGLDLLVLIELSSQGTFSG